MHAVSCDHVQPLACNPLQELETLEAKLTKLAASKRTELQKQVDAKDARLTQLQEEQKQLVRRGLLAGGLA